MAICKACGSEVADKFEPQPILVSNGVYDLSTGKFHISADEPNMEETDFVVTKRKPRVSGGR